MGGLRANKLEKVLKDWNFLEETDGKGFLPQRTQRIPRIRSPLGSAGAADPRSWQAVFSKRAFARRACLRPQGQV